MKETCWSSPSPQPAPKICSPGTGNSEIHTNLACVGQDGPSKKQGQQVCARTYSYVDVHTYIHINARIYVYIYTHIYQENYISKYICICKCRFKSTCIHIFFLVPETPRFSSTWASLSRCRSAQSWTRPAAGALAPSLSLRRLYLESQWQRYQTFKGLLSRGYRYRYGCRCRYR